MQNHKMYNGALTPHFYIAPLPPPASPSYMNLHNFCSMSVPDFTPLGGNRPDCAVVACALMSLCDSRLPWDVVDVGLAALCAPLIIRDGRDVEACKENLCLPRIDAPANIGRGHAGAA